MFYVSDSKSLEAGRVTSHAQHLYETAESLSYSPERHGSVVPLEWVSVFLQGSGLGQRSPDIEMTEELLPFQIIS